MPELKKLNRHGSKSSSSGKQSWANSGQGSRLAGAGRLFSLEKRELQLRGDALDARFGFSRYEDSQHARVGWLLNMMETTLPDTDGKERSGVDLYFLQQNGDTFKSTLFYEPYFYLGVKNEKFITDVVSLCHRRLESVISSITMVEKEDLDMRNHLSGKQAKYLKLSFRNISDLMDAKLELLKRVSRNQRNMKATEAYLDETEFPEDFMDLICDAREYDVPYVLRVSIDRDLRVGAWYTVAIDTGNALVTRLPNMVVKAEPKVMAFDIECTKSPLKFPDATIDEIFMISYMIDGQGYLIIQRRVVSADIDDFEYTPQAAYPGPFHVFNESNEYALLERFFDHIQEVKPHIYVTYNGDFFDWPFIEKRAAHHGMDMLALIGVQANDAGEYRGSCSVHMDAFCWVKRDSYLPQGSQGLKAVTRYKLGYDPVEVDPEDMVKLAQTEPVEMAQYSVSDAVATYYLYEKYVHLFVFSLCTIIPMGSEDVLRKGSGTLCEALLMVEAYRGNIICPNKQKPGAETFYKNHLVESETYIGGHVESLESGVFRADLEYDFELTPAAFDELIANVDRDLTFALEIELDTQRSDVVNYENVRCEIVERLEALRDDPNRRERPLIYHLDVAAMYPNIILTNRLQPCAIVDEATCASCVHNSEENACQRQMDWVWRGDYYPTKRPEVEQIKAQLHYEHVHGQPFASLPLDERRQITKARLKAYCQTAYRKTKISEEVRRTDTVCMRENPFYVNTVRAFRDRRYEYKLLTKSWKKKVDQAESELEAVESSNKALIYDSLQLAHKCILNSFYGYVMRRGARWHSMEMAGIVTNTGSALITRARELVERIGRPLELDTDGIWCILPRSFPRGFHFRTRMGKTLSIDYPCVMLNADVHETYTNHQYQELSVVHQRYAMRSECSIFFELDGPYRCMVLPASTEEGKLLKKRYAVFNFDGSVAELKGFELKRRGELQLIKSFQSAMFERFLDGKNLSECYAAVAESANHWLDVIDTKGADVDDDELFELFTENRVMSRPLEDYGSQKSTAITTATRLGQFLGPDAISGSGLNCKLVIANRPFGTTVTERAIPVVIFSAEPAQQRLWLRKWLRDPTFSEVDIRHILDWSYYRTRLGATIQKIISIPAAFQDVANPVPRVPLPEWMARRVREKTNALQQQTLGFAVVDKPTDVAAAMMKMDDLEDLGRQDKRLSRSIQPKVTRFRHGKHHHHPAAAAAQEESEEEDHEEEDHEEEDHERTKEAFSDWLEQRKKKWKTLRLERKRKQKSTSHQNNNNNNNHHHSLTTRTPAMFNSSSSSSSRLSNDDDDNPLTKTIRRRQPHAQKYHILEIQPLDEPGVFQLWVVSSLSFEHQVVQVSVRRRFYVHARHAMTCHHHSGRRVRQVSRVLPHGHHHHGPQDAQERDDHHPILYEMSMTERMYQEGAKELAEWCADPELKGVYERNVSSESRVVQALGNVMTKSHSSSISRRRDQGDVVETRFRHGHVYDLQHFQSSSSSVYLEEQEASSVHRIGLYYTCSNDLAMIALFFYNNTTSKKQRAQIWICDPYQSDVRPNVQSCVRQVLQECDLPESEAERWHVVSEMVTSISAAHARLNAVLSQHLGAPQTRTSAYVLVALTPYKSKSRLRSTLRGLEALPIVTLAYAESKVFPALSWKPSILCQVLQRGFQDIPQGLRDVVALARVARVPVGNLAQGDLNISALDAMYTRCLEHHKHVLWTSESSSPDCGHGGSGEDLETILGSSGKDDGDGVTFFGLHSNTRVKHKHMMTNPGAYRPICVSIDLDGLAVNAILVAQDIYNIESSRSSSTLQVVHSRSSSDQQVLTSHTCAVAFRILEQLVSTLFRDFVTTRNPFADQLLQHVYRWISSTSSSLYDPMLHSMVSSLISKLYLQLLAEIRNLGATIVYADIGRIILCTTKHDRKSAETYVRFIIKTLHANELFQVLNLTPREYWSNLMFMDIENYGCLRHAGEPDLDLDLNLNTEEDSDVEQVKCTTTIISHWNIARYLPLGMSDYVLILVGQYIQRQYQTREDLEARAAESSSHAGFRHIGFDVEMDNQVDREGQALLRHFFTEKMFHLVPEMLERYHDGNDSRRSFPTLVGSRVLLTDSTATTHPTLEFVKMVCEIFSLDKSIEYEVKQLKAGLLRLLNVSEYAPESAFVNPSVSLVLHDIICLECNYGRNLDLCRDPQLLVNHETEDPTTDAEDPRGPEWCCSRCSAPYDTDAIEMRLVELVERYTAQYQMQDLQCRKCKLFAETQMRTYCSCSGTFRVVRAQETLMSKLLILRQIANYHDFPWLADTIDQIL